MTSPDVAVLLRCIPVLYALAAIPAFCGGGVERAWRWAGWASAIVLAIAVAALASAAWQAHATGPAPDLPGLGMASLISLLGWIILRFSQRYLAGEPGQLRYVAAMLLTLASVSVVAITDNLLLLALAWLAGSLAMHGLLIFYPDRPAARIVAHKKFLASRLADLCLALALLLIHANAGTLSLQGIASHVAQAGQISPGLHAAMMLVALAVIFKSAQLPVHGWLIQVMEAPTPVSALLHAGVVNLGGFVLIRLAVLLSAAPGAQAMLVIVGSLTAVLAGLVTMTRISIKVRLAWSTCAQMGFMLLECGLGLFELAFLHLLAHSLYKAHAFLASGETVADTRRRHLFPASAPRSPESLLAARLAAAPLAVAIVGLSAMAWQQVSSHAALPEVAMVVVGLGLAALLWQEDWRGMGRGMVAVILLTQVYIGWHAAFGALVAPASAPAPVWLVCWTMACFTLLYAVQAWLLAYPDGSFSRALYPWAYAGFYLDERYTRLTFRIWPVSLPAGGAVRFTLSNGKQA